MFHSSLLNVNMKWTEQQIERVRNLSIADSVGEPVGRRVKIPCPTPDHNDHTPSFLIDQDNGFYCFGCGVHGKGFIDFLTVMGFKFQQIMDEYGR